MTRCLREVVAELSGDEREGSEDDEVCAFAIADVHCADGHWHVLLQEAWPLFHWPATECKVSTCSPQASSTCSPCSIYSLHWPAAGLCFLTKELSLAPLNKAHCHPESDDNEQGAMEEQRWDKKGASRRADVVGALRSGLDRLAEVSHNALAHVSSSDLLHRFWACLEVSISSLYVPLILPESLEGAGERGQWHGQVALLLGLSGGCCLLCSPRSSD